MKIQLLLLALGIVAGVSTTQAVTNPVVACATTTLYADVTNPIKLAYGPDGFLASVTDPLGRTTAFTNDPAGRVTAQTLPDSRVVSFAYDGGIFTSATWSGVVTGSVAQTYDSDFRVTALRVNGTDPVAILYDSDSLPVLVGGLVLTRSPTSGFVTATALGALSDRVTYDGFGARVSHTASHNDTLMSAETAALSDRWRRAEEWFEATLNATRDARYLLPLEEQPEAFRLIIERMYALFAL